MGAVKNNAGYDQEEAYFHRQNQELIEKARQKRRLEVVKESPAAVPELPRQNPKRPK